jgi:hypothetical protein
MDGAGQKNLKSEQVLAVGARPREANRLSAAARTKTLLPRTRSRWILAAALAVVLVALRLPHLEADTPNGITMSSVGVFIDEGYKTLAPRNLALYGATKWNANDQYLGWMEASPLTQWPFYWAFKTFGTRLSSARAVTVLWFAILLFSYAFGLWRRYDLKLILLGIAFLGFAHLLFFFSRIALLEVPLSVCIYGCLFFFPRLAHRRPFPTLIAGLGLAVAATAFIKASAAVYFLAIVLGLALGSLVTHAASRILRLRYALPVAVVIGWIVIFTKRWSGRVAFEPEEIIISSFLNPLSYSAVLLVSLSLFCLAQALLSDSKSFFRDPYRAGLAGLALLGPLLLSVFPYHPLRYYVPLVPSYVLLVVEWLHLRQWRRLGDGDRTHLEAVIAIFSTSVMVFMLGQGLNLYVLHNIPVAIGETPGISDRFMRDYFLLAVLPLTFGIAILVWQFRGQILKRKILVW